MPLDTLTLYAFLLVFLRCSAMLLSSPLFGSQGTPVQIRIMATLALSGAFVAVVRPEIGSVPTNLAALALACGGEIASGLLVGATITMVLQAAAMAGAILDLEMGLGISQVLNPATGIPVTILSELKFMLATVVFFCANGHHTMILAVLNSYKAAPSLSMASLPGIEHGLVALLGGVTLVAMQIAAPVLAVGVVVDAALGLINKAVPQIQVFLLGAPAKVILGLMAVCVCLPAITSAVTVCVDQAFSFLGHAFGM